MGSLSGRMFRTAHGRSVVAAQPSGSHSHSWHVVLVYRLTLIPSFVVSGRSTLADSPILHVLLTSHRRRFWFVPSTFRRRTADATAVPCVNKKYGQYDYLFDTHKHTLTHTASGAGVVHFVCSLYCRTTNSC